MWAAGVLIAATLGGLACSSSSPTRSDPPPPLEARPAASPSPTPSPSPAAPASLIAEVRVSFFGIRCGGGRVPPGNTKKQLPLGCSAAVTATPKQAGEIDLPHDAPGLEVQWDLAAGGQFVVKVTDFPDQPFNKNVDARRVGSFTLCAVVNGVQGCLNGEVIP